MDKIVKQMYSFRIPWVSSRFIPFGTCLYVSVLPITENRILYFDVVLREANTCYSLQVESRMPS